MWYGSEILQHHETEERELTLYNSCVIIHLADITHQVTITIISTLNLRKNVLYHNIYQSKW